MTTEQIHTTLIDLGWKYVGAYEKEKFKLEMLNTLPSVRKVVLTIYYGLVAKKKVVAIEELILEDRKKLWDQCKEFCAGLTVEERKDFARCYSALDYLAGKRN